MTARFRDRLAFDEARGEIRDETRRYMMMRPEALMGLFRRLDGPARDAAFAALFDSIVEMGGDSARAYRAHGGGDPDRLLETVAATAPDLGWGVWRFERSGGGLSLEVANSPFAAGHGPSHRPVCAAVAGMATAVARMVLGDHARAVETACAACGAPACRFEAR
jgi:hypothetical protein